MGQFLLPDLGEGLEEAQVVQWLVQAGETVQLNQPLCQVETAKALVDIPSPFAGTVQALHATPGESVAVGSPLITIAESSTSASAAPAEGTGPVLVGYGTDAPASQGYARRPRAQASLAGAPAATSSAAGPSAAVASHAVADNDVVNASPLVRRMAQERGIDLRTVRGSGPGGRIRSEDLDALAVAPAAATDHSAASVPAEADEERISTVGLRKAIAARMVRASSTIPHFTEYGLFDASALVALRERMRAEQAQEGKRPSYLPFFVRALIDAVQAYPIMNSRWDDEGNAIVLKRSIHVGIATDTPRGLLVPVIANAHTLSLPALAAEADRLIERARAGTLDAKSLSGGTITITNVGASGPVETGSPLINPPEVCIVGFGALKLRPTVVGEQVVARPGAWISISCDHRVVDGATAARFLGVLVERLEAPEQLVRH